MKVKMEVAVDVVHQEAGGTEFLELGVDFGAQLFTQVPVEEIVEANARRIFRELLTCVHESGNFFEREGGMAAEEGEVEADAKGGRLASEGHRFVKGGFVYHEAGGGEDAFAMSADDGFIDGMRAAEVVGVNDQPAGGESNP
jgi:hypothetical protein